MHNGKKVINQAQAVDGLRAIATLASPDQSLDKLGRDQLASLLDIIAHLVDVSLPSSPPSSHS